MFYEKICPYCKGKNIVKCGIRKNKSDNKQMYWCNDCKRRYTIEDGFWKMKNKPEIIAEAVSCYSRGLSLQAVKDHLQDWREVKVSRKTVLTWVRKYSKILADWEEKNTPKIKGPIHMDEIVVKTKGKKNWRWGAKDKKTRYKYRGSLTEKRTYEDGAKPLFKNIEERTRGQVKELKKHGKKLVFVSDKLGHYRKGFNKYFYRTGKLYHGVPIACKRYGLKYNNNPIERDNQRVRQRTKVMRGFKNNESGCRILDLIDVEHNYIHELKLEGEKRARSPAERANIKIDIGETKRLLNLIKFFFSSSKFYGLEFLGGMEYSRS